MGRDPMFVMAIVGTWDRDGTPVATEEEVYVREYDADGLDGYGRVEFTGEVHEALRFTGLPELLACWSTTSSTRSVRTDGRPNRPLTAYSIRPTGVRWCEITGRWVLVRT